MHTPKKHVLLLKFLLPLQIEKWNIKNFVPLLIASLECLLHLEDVNFECRTNNQQWWHLVLVKDFRAVELGLALNGLNSPIEGQGVCIWHHLRSLQKNSKCYKYTTKTMKTFQNFANKKVPNAPNTLGVTIILVTKIF
jgi:hypothetical protein